MNILSNFINDIRTFGLEILGLLYSVYTGKVKSNVDKTFMGRIKVFLDSLSLPGSAGVVSKRERDFLSSLNLRISEDKNQLSVLPISPYAGTNFGFYFPPDISKDQSGREQNVVVVFPQGRPSNPMYIGSWWYRDAIPVEFRNADGTVTKRGIKTKAGHYILFEDDDKNGNIKRIEIKSSSGHKVVANDKEHKVDVTSAGGLFVEIDDNSNKITLDAKGTKIIIDGNAKKVYLWKESGTHPYIKSIDQLSWAQGHRHLGVHGITSPPIPSPGFELLSDKIFGE